MNKADSMLKTLAVAIIANLIGGGLAAAAPTKESIDASIRRTMEEFNVPGMAVSVIYDGEIFYSAGQGVVEIGKAKRVDDRTLFQIGSLSKAFTTAAFAVLADDGKLDWDDRVIDYLPEFRMNDPWVTREFTIRDLLTHRSGLPLGAGDLLMFPEGKTSRDEIVHALRYLKPATSFRSQFAYDNLMYIVAGEVVAAVSGMPFEDFVEERVFRPLDMDDCVGAPERIARRAVAATAHVLVDGELQTTTTRISGLIAAAGGVTCSARSMANWMSFLLNEGKKSDGEELISAAQFYQLTQPVTPLPVSGYLAEHTGAFMNAYALGWGVSTFYGEPLISHGGAVWGMTTFIALLPKQGLAVFASNNQMSPAPRAIVNDVIDQFLRDENDQAGKDWIAIISGVSGDRQAAGEDAVAKAWESRSAESKPSLPLETYTGTYRDTWYGDIHISMGDDGGLWFDSERNAPLKGPLRHFQYDTFVAEWSDRQLMADSYVTFSLSPDGVPDRIKMKAVSPTTDFSYDFHDLDLVRIPSE